MTDAELLDHFRAHMERCAAIVLAPMRRPDLKVTIVVRAPEALPEEGLVTSNDNLSLVIDVLEYMRKEQK